MKKKIMVLMLILSVSFIMVSCGNQSDRDSNSNSSEDRVEQEDTRTQETDDAESHIIIKETIVNGAFGIEIVSSGSYGKYYGEYIGIPDRDM